MAISTVSIIVNRSAINRILSSKIPGYVCSLGKVQGVQLRYLGDGGIEKSHPCKLGL